MTPRYAALLVALGAAAAGSWYLVQVNKSQEEQPRAKESVYRGYYLESARILGTGEHGEPLYQIEAERAEQREDRRIEFSGVRIRYSPEREIPWVVEADSATLKEEDPRIVLRGHVIATSSGDDESSETEIRTQYLELDPERFVAETEERVQIRVGARSLTATGMLASLNENKVELKSNVRGKIAP